MKKSTLNIHIRANYLEYRDSLVMCIIRKVSPAPVVFEYDRSADLEIIGPFPSAQSLGRRIAKKLFKRVSANISKYMPERLPSKVKLYHTEENTRYNSVPADFSISSDLGVASKAHFRMPNWWGSIDWSAHGIKNSPSPRVRQLIDIADLLTPLGDSVLNKPFRGVMFSSHLREPRGTIFSEAAKVIALDGYGPAFDKSITDHNRSGIFKDEIMPDYMFSICPENSMYPGYYTEKVPESYAAGCIPITWADQNIASEFVPGSFINLADHAHLGYAEGLAEQLRPEARKKLVGTPLLAKEPDFKALVDFIENIVTSALKA